MALTVRSAKRSLLVTVIAAGVCSPSAGAATLGGLTQLGGTSSCVTNNGSLGPSGGVCTAAPEMNEANSMLISPDGKFAYVNGFRQPTWNIVTFSRNTATGALAPLSGKDYCLNQDGSGSGGPGSCTDARAIGYSNEGDSLAMTKDGAFLYVGGWSTSAVAAFKRDSASGKLTQLAGTDGCVSVDGEDEDNAATCTDGRVLTYPHSVTLSPDERFAYVTSNDFAGVAGVAIFARDTTTGRLTQLAGTDGCATSDGTSEDGAGTCQNLRGGGYANSFAITPDGKHAYLPNYDASSLAILNIDPATGKISQPGGTAGCISMDGSSEDGAATCQDTGVLNGAWHAAVSPDGQTLYVLAYSTPAVSIFRIDAASGALTRLAGTDHCISNDGSSDEGAGTCQDGRGLRIPEGITISADGRSLYATSYPSTEDAGVVVFAADPATGKLTQLAGKDGCFTQDGSSLDGADTCTDISSEGGSYKLALSPDQAFAYLPSAGPGGPGAGSITAFSRQAPPVCTNVTGATAFQTPFVQALPCSDPNGDAFTREIVAGPGHGSLGAITQATGSVTYTPAAAFSGADSFTFRATDPASSSAPATASITVGAPTVDSTAPACTRTVASRLSLKRLRFSIVCDETVAVTAKLKLTKAAAKKLKIKPSIASGKAIANAKAKTQVTLKLTKKAKKRLKKLSKAKLRKLRLALTITATDISKNKKTLTAKVKLKR